jgi:hypothetical protein
MRGLGPQASDRARPLILHRRALFVGGTKAESGNYIQASEHYLQEEEMGRGILLWLLGVPIPIIILLMLFAR